MAEYSIFNHGQQSHTQGGQYYCRFISQLHVKQTENAAEISFVSDADSSKARLWTM